MAQGVQLRLEFQFRNQRFADAEKGLLAFAQEFDRGVAKLPRILAKNLDTYLRATRQALLKRHSKRFVNPTHAPATGEDALLRRSGGMDKVRTFVQRSQDLSRVAGGMIIPFPISVHEEGATVRARRVQYLTVPLPAALDNRGLPIRPNARAWDNTFVQRSRRGNLLIFRREAGRITPLYLLKRSVQIPPRLKALETLAAGEDFFVDSTIADFFQALGV